MKPKLSSHRSLLIRVDADGPNSVDEERETERKLDAALDAALDEIRAYAAVKLLALGQVSILTGG